MAYNPFEWADGEDGGTPITAERLNHMEDGIEDAASTATWGQVANRPSTFNPSSHDHPISEVTGLQVALDGKQATGDYATQGDVSDAIDAIPAPTWGDVSGKPSTFAPADHEHEIADVTGLQSALDNLQSQIDGLNNGDDE